MKKNIILTLIIIFIDQIIKFFVEKYLDVITIIPNFFKLTYVKNTGAAFSILNNNTLLIIVITIIVMYILYKYILKEYETISYLLMGGIIGNFIDRVFRGYVVDYLDFKILGYNFPIFNFADICIVIGSILLIIIILKEDKHGINRK